MRRRSHSRRDSVCCADIDLAAQHRYAHGPLYSVYVAVYLLVAALIIVMFIDYGRRFRR